MDNLKCCLQEEDSISGTNVFAGFILKCNYFNLSLNKNIETILTAFCI